MDEIDNMADYLHDPAIVNETPEPGLLLADHFIKAFGYRGYRPKGTDAWLLFYTLGGEGVIRIGKDERICRKHDVVMLKPGAPHNYFTKAGSEWNFYWVYFIPRISWSEWMVFKEEMKGCSIIPIAGGDIQGRMVHACKRMVKDGRQNGPIRQELALNALEEIFLLIYKEKNKEGKASLDPRIRTVLEQLSENYTSPQTIDALASKTRLSASRLSHLFKEQVGDSVIDFLLKIRLKNGERLLLYTSMSIGEVAEKVGFRSPHYFSRAFASFYGMSPTMYRDKFR